MSTSSRRSLLPNHCSVNSVKSFDVDRRHSRASSRAPRFEPSHEDTFSFALRVAFLHYLLQPKQKRRKFVPTPAPPKRHSTIAVADMMSELKGRDSKGFKLPHNFHKDLEKRLTGVLAGHERIPGFNDSGVKRSTANAYNSFTEADFRRSALKDRKIEQYILVFYSRATAACISAAPDGNSYKRTVDRHVALFIRLVISIIKDHGSDRLELVAALQNLENKLKDNDQALFIASTSNGEGTYVEEDIPLTYDVKDMNMVQVVARVFGKTNSETHTFINENKDMWTEEAALKDLKAYQQRLGAGFPETLNARDFDLDEAFQDWKRHEIPALSQMMLDILKAKPDLAKTNTDNDKPLPQRPTSLYGTEQAYADLGRAVQSSDAGDPYGFDASMALGSMSLDGSSGGGSVGGIRVVDDRAFVFMPSHPREHYKYIVNHVMQYDLLQANSGAEDFQPLADSSLEFLLELSVRWRIPQFTRLVVLVEVAVSKFLNSEITDVGELGMTFDFVKENQPEVKKPPHLYQYNIGLSSIDSSRWTIHDFASYRQALHNVHKALQRELYEILTQTYRVKKAPTHKVVCLVLKEHVYDDASFSQRPEDQKSFTQQLTAGLQEAAMASYSGILENCVPENQEEWNFSHVVQLGKKVVGLCKTLKKKFAKTPEIQGANPYRIFVEAVFPNFETDAHEMIKRIFLVSKEKGVEIPVEEAFLLYEEMKEICDHHEEVLPEKPFAFSVEELLADFVWQYLKVAEGKIEGLVDEAIKSDSFQVRSREEQEPTDDDRHSLSVIDMFRSFMQIKNGLFDLEWRNSYHTARFRTGLARIISNGIGRYCEAVEAQFSKEMDRPSAQDISTQQQSGFLKYAKDALATREKPEPFQFYPQSFVKLNNIEYAMQTLDKLEKDFDVDQCVSIIEARDGPLQRNSRAPSKYVFTIKIVEAEDLKACDPSGFSDPYVVLCDEFQNRLYKTRIISRNLNPQWNESIDITVTHALNVIATVWDYDTFGDHDFVGRTSLKLDPRHFGDYLPREFWLDLDTQGRLLIRVSMEGERDDIQFHFGKAFRYLKRAERDMVRKITDKLVAEIRTTISLESLRGLLSQGIGASISSFWNKRTSTVPTVTQQDMANALQPLVEYFEDNFEIMKQTLTGPTLIAVMSRLWKEVLMAIENLVVPPVSDKPSTQRPLNQKELDIIFFWKDYLFRFFNVRDAETGEALGVPETVLKNPKWHDLGSLYFFYHEPTDHLIRESERMAAAAHQRERMEASGAAGSRYTAPASLMAPNQGATHLAVAAGGGFASMGTIRRGKSISMNRNLGTMRRVKEEKRKEAQAEPSDDMILRILRMRPEAAGYLKDRARQKERMQAISAASMIVRNSVLQGFGTGPSSSGTGAFGRGGVPRR